MGNNQLIITENTGWLQTRVGSSKTDLRLPYEQDIFLLDSVVIVAEANEASGISAGERLALRSEGNDNIATVLHGEKELGRLPIYDGVIPARLLAAGKKLFCSVEEVEEKGRCARIKLKIYLRD